MKNYTSFPVDNFNKLKSKMLNWANQFSIFCLLDNMQYRFDEPAFECMLAVGCKQKISANSGDAFDKLKSFCKHHDGWLFGHFSYDIKNETEKLCSNNFDGIDFPDMFFFEPEVVIQLNEKELQVFCDEDEAEKIVDSILSFLVNEEMFIPIGLNIRNRINKETYIDTIKKIKANILRGDCYEINFCQEFFIENVSIHPIKIYEKLTAISPNPFAALYKLEDKYCICASPERYIKKTGNKIISQPVKGTAKRNLNNQQEDEKNKLSLVTSDKEKSENVMVVDLVRNDLSKVCKEATVIVEELFGIYSFPQVHQMISTISGIIKEDADWIDVIKATFPMGSMTGAPKKKVMELIEKYEQTKRGLFSGTIGYVKPGGDMDFNVVIRSVFYNETNKYISFQAGSAITFNSDPEKEYEECMLKTAAIREALK